VLAFFIAHDFPYVEIVNFYSKEEVYQFFELVSWFTYYLL